MGIASAAFRAFVVLSSFLAAGVAAQHEGTAPSPYSLGLSVGRAPIGLSASTVVGRAQFSSFSAFGKVGTATAVRPDTSLMGMGASIPVEPASGLSWGGGVSYDLTPRVTATLEWISYDLRMAGGPVRTTSLGLQVRY